MTAKLVTKICKGCKKEFTSLAKDKNRQYCSRQCYRVNCGGANNPAFGKIYCTKQSNPEWAQKIQQTMIDNKVNVGDKNAMKRIDVRIKMSKTRREKVTSNLAYRKYLSEKAIERWKNGRYDNASVGKCKWYTYQKKDGTSCKVQGTWELAYVKWLDDNNIRFVAHRGRITYTENDIQRSYYPDFYLLDLDQYVDIKNDYHFNLNSNKFVLIKDQNKHLNIKILFKKDLLELGIKL